MTQSFKVGDVVDYAVLSVRPYPNRAEHVNIGVVTWPAPNMKGCIIHLGDYQAKTKALAPKMDIDMLESNLKSFAEKAKGYGKDEFLVWIDLYGVGIGHSTGTFLITERLNYDDQIGNVMRSLVDPEHD